MSENASRTLLEREETIPLIKEWTKLLVKVFDEPIYEDLSYSTDFGELFQESLFWENWWHFGEMINLESFNPIVSRIEETTEKFIHCLSSELQIVEYIRAAVDFFTGQTGSLDTIGSFLSDAENGKSFLRVGCPVEHVLNQPRNHKLLRKL